MDALQLTVEPLHLLPHALLELVLVLEQLQKLGAEAFPALLSAHSCFFPYLHQIWVRWIHCTGLEVGGGKASSWRPALAEEKQPGSRGLWQPSIDGPRVPTLVAHASM